MPPKRVSFPREAVLDAALALVRERGFDALTARAVAERLGASVAPVYSAFGSMDALGREVLREARRRLDAHTREAYTDVPFLNIGVGIVVFAREEPALFRALFLTRHHFRDVLASFDASVLERMKADAMLRLLPDRSLRRLLDNVWLFTLGLAAAVIVGGRPASTASIVRALRDAGNMMMHAEVVGTADAESPESGAAWAGAIAGRKIVLPEEAALRMARPCPPKSPAGKRKEKRS